MVFLFNANVVVTPTNVEFRKQGFSLKSFDNVADEGKGIVVTDGPLIQGSVVHDRTKLSTLLFAIKQGGGVW